VTDASTSILSWRCTFSDGDPVIVVEYPSSDEVAALTEIVEGTLRRLTREGYEIRCIGSCCKAPQGLNWTVTIVFESVESANAVAQALQLRFGEPGAPGQTFSQICQDMNAMNSASAQQNADR